MRRRVRTEILTKLGVESNEAQERRLGGQQPTAAPADTAVVPAVPAADDGGYIERYWVSVSDGLLCAAEKLNGDEVVYRMAGMTVDTAAVSADTFTLPDGTALHVSEASADR